MDLHEARYFLALAEKKNMTRAAEAVHITQPALSQYLKKLEKEIGGPLFIRRGNGRLELTEAGRIYLHFCEDTMKLWTDTEQQLKGLFDNPEPLRIGVALSRRAITFFNHYSQLKPQYPDLNVNIDYYVAADMPQLVLSGKLDVAFSAWIERLPGLTYREFSRQEGCLMVPEEHPLAVYSCLKPGQENLRIPIRFIGNSPMVGLRSSVLGRQIDDFLKREGFSPNITLWLNNITEIQHFTASSRCLSIVTPKEIIPGTVPVRLENTFEHFGGYYFRTGQEFREGERRLIAAYIKEYREEDWTKAWDYN